MRIKLLIPILIPLAFTSCDFVGKQMMKERFKDFDIDAISSGMSLMKTAGKPLVFTLPELECGQEYAAPMSEFLDSIYIVPLETTPESLIGYPSKMMVCNDTLYVLDTMKGKSLKRFTMDGRYIDKIAGVGNGPGEFVEPTDFYVGSQIEILDQFQEKIMNIYQANCRITGIDDGGSPYMFVLNEDHTISHLFIPHKEFPNMIAWYLETVKHYLAHHQ